jgi:hypothetical protein
MKIWMYSLGEWIKDGYELLDWNDDEDESNWFTRNGFDTYFREKIGKREDLNCITFFESSIQDNEQTLFLCRIPSMVKDFYFFIPDMPSFLIFKKEYGVLFVRPILIKDSSGHYLPLNSIKNFRISKRTSSECLTMSHSEYGEDEICSWDFVEDDKGKKYCRNKAEEWLLDRFEII